VSSVSVVIKVLVSSPHQGRVGWGTAYGQFNAPIYSAEHVRIRLGYELECSEGENSPLVASAGRSPMAAGPSPEDYVWTYESPKFPMKQVLSLTPRDIFMNGLQSCGVGYGH
jgi:hypothetical protein